LEVPALSSTELLSNTQSENSQIIKTRILEARGRQQKRFADAGITANSHMNHRQIKKSCTLDTEGKKLLKAAIDELGLSARAYDKILKVARTIADLANEENILPEHIAEAIQYRCLDRSWWG
ncbi:MAG: magnesium chelatase, partial [Candidatus Omnitrophica bacterium]|nr:magnesium chelatase [Candidatus Omnitrophota bacterium]